MCCTIFLVRFVVTSDILVADNNLFYLPEVIYNKLKKAYKEEFKKVDLVKICNILIMKGIFKKNEYSMNIMLDLLKEVK